MVGPAREIKSNRPSAAPCCKRLTRTRPSVRATTQSSPTRSRAAAWRESSYNINQRSMLLRVSLPLFRRGPPVSPRRNTLAHPPRHTRGFAIWLESTPWVARTHRHSRPPFGGGRLRAIPASLRTSGRIAAPRRCHSPAPQAIPRAHVRHKWKSGCQGPLPPTEPMEIVSCVRLVAVPRECLPW
jgi:hypothetical protein